MAHHEESLARHEKKGPFWVGACGTCGSRRRQWHGEPAGIFCAPASPTGTHWAKDPAELWVTDNSWQTFLSPVGLSWMLQNPQTQIPVQIPYEKGVRKRYSSQMRSPGNIFCQFRPQNISKIRRNLKNLKSRWTSLHGYPEGKVFDEKNGLMWPMVVRNKLNFPQFALIFIDHFCE